LYGNPPLNDFSTSLALEVLDTKRAGKQLTLSNSTRTILNVDRLRNDAGREVVISKSEIPSVISLRTLLLLLCCMALVLVTSVAGLARAEFRGAWVTAWNHGFLSPEEADATISAAKAANINALFIQVRKVGDAYYDSDLEPRASNISGPADYDPLAYIIEAAHSEGIEIHAWINVLRVQSGTGSNSDPRHVCNKHPDWLSSDSSGREKSPDGFFLDPGVPAVQDYTVRIVADLLKKYDIDGIHLDYVRYPGSQWGYNPEAVARFNTRFGRSGQPAVADEQWLSWRRDQVTALVRKVHSKVNAVRPDVKLSAAAISWGDCCDRFEDTAAYRQALQDWAAWMREGILDAAVPMNYRKEASAGSSEQYRRWLHGMRRWQGDRHVYAGQMVGQDLNGAIAQLRASRETGTEGMVCFTLNDTPARDALVSALKRTVYAQPAEPPSMPWKQRLARVPGRVERTRIP
jgi:uncharacterized lipoprotein YddW (UPF0748 family)